MKKALVWGGAAVVSCAMMVAVSGCSDLTCEEAARKLDQCTMDAMEGEAMDEGEGGDELTQAGQEFLDTCEKKVPGILRGFFLSCFDGKECDDIKKAEDPVALCFGG